MDLKCDAPGGCRVPVAFRCVCPRCTREGDRFEERFYSCSGHQSVVAVYHLRIRDRHVTWEAVDDPLDGLELKFNAHPVCPHCRHVDDDVWEHDFRFGTRDTIQTTCVSCEKPYLITKHVEVTYSTATPDPK